MPKNWPPTNFNHGFGLEMAFFGNPRSKSAGENNSFHMSLVEERSGLEGVNSDNWAMVI